MTPSLKVTAMIEVPKLRPVSLGSSSKHSCDSERSLDLALLQPIHVDVDTI